MVIGGTQIWLMGDGTLTLTLTVSEIDVYAADQNYGKLQFNSMASNDIQNVTISGLVINNNNPMGLNIS